MTQNTQKSEKTCNVPFVSGRSKKGMLNIAFFTKEVILALLRIFFPKLEKERERGAYADCSTGEKD